MKLVLFSTQKFLIDELNHSSLFEDIIVIKEIDQVFDQIDEREKFVFLHHLDVQDNFQEILVLLNTSFIDFKAIALRNSPNNIEGCELLKKGYKSYLHSMSNVHIIEDAVTTVLSGNIWVYPELMQFLINAVPVKEASQESKLKLLSVKELEVLKLVSEGLSNSEISEVLNIAQVTVKKHISSMFKKLELKDRLSLALFYKNQ